MDDYRLKANVDENNEYYFESLDGQRFKNPADAIDRNMLIRLSEAREIVDREIFEEIYRQLSKEK